MHSVKWCDARAWSKGRGPGGRSDLIQPRHPGRLPDGGAEPSFEDI